MENKIKNLIPPHVVDAQGYGINEFYTPEQVCEILSLLGVRWIPISDRLPEPLETVWITNGRNFATLGCRVIEDGEYYWATTNGIIYVENKTIVSECEYDDVDDVQYWHPLPKLPTI